METYGSYVEQVLSKLTRLHGLEGRASEIQAVFGILTAECLAYPLGSRPPKKFSTLCWDGTPIEFSVSVSDRPCGLRYVTEIADASLSIQERLLRARERTPMILGALHEEPTNLGQIFDTFFPSGARLARKLGFGVWHGIVHLPETTLLKLYFNLRWRAPSEAWKCFRLLLGNSHKDVAAKADSVNTWFGSRAQPVAAGLELSGTGIEAVKIYFRVFKLSTILVRELLALVDLAESFDSFLEFERIMLGGPREYKRPVIFSVQFPTKESEPLSVAFEVAAASYLACDELIRDRLCDIISLFGYDKSIYEGTLQVLSKSSLSSKSIHLHTMMGVGLSTRGKLYPKVYMKPQLWWSNSAR